MESRLHVFILVLTTATLVPFSTLAKAPSKAAKSPPKQAPKAQVFEMNAKLNDAWRPVDMPKRNPFGFEKMIARKANLRDAVSFGFRSPGTLTDPKKLGCDLEIERQREDKTVRTVRFAKAPAGWDCLIETTNIDQTRQYYGLREIVIETKKQKIPFEVFFATQGHVNEIELNKILANVTVAHRKGKS